MLVVRFLEVLPPVLSGGFFEPAVGSERELVAVAVVVDLLGVVGLVVVIERWVGPGAWRIMTVG